MWKSVLSCLAALSASVSVSAADLTDTEQRWLNGIWPVVAYARETKLPLDIVVQPQPTPGHAPLALAFVEGRCKLVLSMRGNSEAQATLERIEAELLAPVLELMAAHELGHCRRHLDGAWHVPPARHVIHVPQALDADLHADYLRMQATRREEAYGDLVGLAWTARHHPQQYARVHAWLTAERSKDLIPGSHHDTLAWVGLARAAVSPLPSLFEGPTTLWLAGFAAIDDSTRVSQR